MPVRFRSLFIAVLGTFILGVPLSAHAAVISEFLVDLRVDEDGLLTVREQILYDFEGEQRHGMFRDIPYSYVRNGSKYITDIDIQSVSNAPDPEGVLAATPYQVSRSSGNVHIRIGDPEVFVTGEQLYEITYTVAGAINWFDGEPEIYWNATGTDWPVRIESSGVLLTAPVTLLDGDVLCFTGVFGSQEHACTISTDENHAAIYVERALHPSEGLTVVARLPVGSIPEPTAAERLWKFVRDNWGVVLPIGAFVLMGSLYRKRGKDPAGRGTIIPEYDAPEGMTPAMLGYLVDGTINARDVTAALLNLAMKGHLTIEYVDKTFGHTYRLRKNKGKGKPLSAFERGIFDAIFDFSTPDAVTFKELRKTLPAQLTKLKNELRDEAQTQQFFTKKPQTVRGQYITLGILLLFGGGFTAGVSGNVATGIGILLSGIIVLSFAAAMPQRTEKGVRLREQILGFKRYLSVAEADRLKFHNAPQKTPEQFYSLLPYAVALAVEKEWAKQFKDITLEQPGWYTGQDFSTFNAVLFASSISDFSKSSQSQAFTAPAKSGGSGGSGFSGGGFSGGGFGGGGGGSW